VDFLPKLVLERSKKSNRHVPGEAVYNFGCEKFAFIGDGAE